MASNPIPITYQSNTNPIELASNTNTYEWRMFTCPKCPHEFFGPTFLNVTMLHVTCNFAEVPTITVDFRLTILVAIDPGHKKKKRPDPEGPDQFCPFNCPFSVPC